MRVYLLILLAMLIYPSTASACTCHQSKIKKPSVHVSKRNTVTSTWVYTTKLAVPYLTYTIRDNHGGIVMTETTIDYYTRFIDTLPSNTKHHKRYTVTLRISNGHGCGVNKWKAFYTR